MHAIEHYTELKTVWLNLVGNSRSLGFAGDDSFVYSEVLWLAK